MLRARGSFGMRLVVIFVKALLLLLLVVGCGGGGSSSSSGQEEEETTGGQEEDLKATQAESESASQEQVDAVDELIEQFHLCQGEFVKGNPEPCKKLFSHWEDVTLNNPLSPLAHGWEQVASTMDSAASPFRDGEFLSAETIEKHVTPELAYIVEIERGEAKIGGSEDITPWTRRVTMIFRPEDGEWKIVHWHADPITTTQPAESVFQE